MKRKFAILTALALALSILSGCGGQTDPSKGTADGSGAAADAQSGEAVPSRENGGGNAAEAGDGAVTMRAIFDANRRETLVSSRGSIQVHTDYNPEVDATGLVLSTYADGELVYQETDSTHELFTAEGSYLYQDGYYGAPLTPEPLTLDNFDSLTMDEDLTLLEEITSIEEGDGVLTVRTVLSAEAIAGFFGPEQEGYAYAAGEYTTEEYVLDAADLALLSDSTTLYHADGTSIHTGTMTAEYGADRPEEAENLLEHLHAPDRRTVTLIMDQEEDYAQTLSVTAQKGDAVFPYLPEGYYVLYRDPAYTDAYDETTADLDSDLTLYTRYMYTASVMETEDGGGTDRVLEDAAA